jgi:hypothetical protein
VPTPTRPLPHGTMQVPFAEMVAMGRVQYWRMIAKFGRNTSIGATQEDIWVAGGVIVYPSVAIVASVVSDDAADAIAGTGGRTVLVSGLDADYIEVSETVELAGLTPVATVQTFIRINTTQVILAGSSLENAGDITASLNGNVQTTIEATEGLNHDSHYHVPAGHTAYLLDAITWQGADSTAQVGFYYHTDGVDTARISPGNFLSYREPVSAIIGLNFEMLEKGDIKMTAANLGGGTIDQAVYYRLLLTENR